MSSRILTGVHPLALAAWSVLLVAGIVLSRSFAMDYPNIMAGGMPHPFNWPLFALGEMTGLGAFLHAILTRSDEC